MFISFSAFSVSPDTMSTVSVDTFIEEQTINVEALVLYMKMHVRINAGKPEKAHN